MSTTPTRHATDSAFFYHLSVLVTTQPAAALVCPPSFARSPTPAYHYILLAAPFLFQDDVRLDRAQLLQRVLVRQHDADLVEHQVAVVVRSPFLDLVLLADRRFPSRLGPAFAAVSLLTLSTAVSCVSVAVSVCICVALAVGRLLRMSRRSTRALW